MQAFQMVVDILVPQDTKTLGSFLKVSYNVESETKTVNILYSITVKSVLCFEFLLLLSMHNFMLVIWKI